MSFLKSVSTVKDPAELARDVVQEVWETLYRQQRFTKGLFVTAVLCRATNAARDSRPITITRTEGREKGRQARVTHRFPVQIFGGLLCEVTTEAEVEVDPCE